MPPAAWKDEFYCLLLYNCLKYNYIIALLERSKKYFKSAFILTIPCIFGHFRQIVTAKAPLRPFDTLCRVQSQKNPASND